MDLHPVGARRERPAVGELRGVQFLSEQRGDPRAVGGRLEFQAEAGPRARDGQQVLQGRHPLPFEPGVEPRAGVEALDLGERELADPPGLPLGVDLLHVGRPGERVVVQQHDLAVGRQLNIALQDVGPLADGVAVGGERLLGRLPRRPAVPDDHRVVPLACLLRRGPGDTGEGDRRGQHGPASEDGDLAHHDPSAGYPLDH
ncbi:hypothetical protein LUX73_07865 [Actinomadura madurae]|nr:hypothetical protein [Actinomadura madurae]MCQ0004638.1 hypothetical protein [Actinomadura madurae]